MEILVLIAGIFFLLISIGFFSFIIYALVYIISHCYKSTKIMSSTKTSSISESENEYVELRGYLCNIQGTKVETPLSKVKCSWYKLRVKPRTGQNINTQNINQNISVFDKESEQPIMLKDETGTCLIIPIGFDISGVQQKSSIGNKLYPTDPDCKESGKVFGIQKRTYYYYETYITSSEPIYAIGNLHKGIPDNDIVKEYIETNKEALKSLDLDNTKIFYSEKYSGVNKPFIGFVA